MSNEPVRRAGSAPVVACIGAGHWGKNVVRNFHALGALGAVCDADAAVRDGVAGRYPDVAVLADLHEAIRHPGIEAVAVCTPAETHGAIVRQALEAGKDVFVEKPLCLDLDEGRELVDLAERLDRILMVGHLLWYHDGILKLHRLVADGELGRLQHISSTRLNFGRIRRSENILWSFAPHDVSVILGLVGERPASIRAHGASYLHPSITDVTTSFFTFPSGVSAHISVSWLHPFKEQKLVVVGDRKMAVFDGVSAEDNLVLYPHTVDWRNNVPTASKAEGEPIPFDDVEPLRSECARFLQCLETRERPRTDGQEALRVLEVLTESQRLIDEEQRNIAAAHPYRTNGSDPLARNGTRPETFFVHESSYVDDDVEIGDGTNIWHFSHVMTGSRIGQECRIGQNVVIGPRARVGNGVKIQNNVSVYEGVTLEDHVFCGPSMVFTNVHNPRSEIRRMHELRKTLVRRGASLGANCTVICGVTIGRYAFVGAGAVVTRDVPDRALVVGSPARIVGWMCDCGHRIRFSDGTADQPEGTGVCLSCGTEYEVPAVTAEPVRPRIASLDRRNGPKPSPESIVAEPQT